MKIRNFLMRSLEKLTGSPRYHPEDYEIDRKLHWTDKIYVANIFRAWEYLFGRKFGIRAEVSSAIEEVDGIVRVKYELYSFEAHVVHLEVMLRQYIYLLKTYLINTLTFQPLPRLDYRPVYATLGVLGFVFSFKTKAGFLPLFGLAIALDATSKGTATGTSPLAWNATCTGSNLILIAGVSVGASGPTNSAVSYNSAALTVVSSTQTNGNGLAGLWYKLGPSTGSNSVSVTFGGTLPTCHAGVVSWSGVAQTGQPDATAVHSGTGKSVTVTTVADNSWAVGIATSSNGALTADLTLRQTLATGGSFNVEGNFEDTNAPKTPAGAQTVSWTTSSIVNAIVAASFAPAAAGSSPSASVSPSSSGSPSASLSPSASISASVSPSASPSPSEPAPHPAPNYGDKYSAQGNSYDDKYTNQNNQYKKKYPTKNPQED